MDISTPAETFERVDAAVTAHFEGHPSEFTGKHLVCANNAGDPLKYMLCVWWEYAQSGEHACLGTAMDDQYMTLTRSLSLGAQLGCYT